MKTGQNISDRSLLCDVTQSGYGTVFGKVSISLNYSANCKYLCKKYLEDFVPPLRNLSAEVIPFKKRTCSNGISLLGTHSYHMMISPKEIKKLQGSYAEHILL